MIDALRFSLCGDAICLRSWHHSEIFAARFESFVAAVVVAQHGMQVHRNPPHWSKEPNFEVQQLRRSGINNQPIMGYEGLMMVNDGLMMA